MDGFSMFKPKRSFFQKYVIKFVIYFDLIVAAILMANVYYSLLRPLHILDIKGPIEILNKHIKPGDPVLIKSNFCKYEDYPARTTYQMVGANGQTIYLGEINTRLPVGCSTYSVYDIHVQLFTPKGQYKLQVDVDYSVNLIRTESYRSYSEDFFVK